MARRVGSLVCDAIAGMNRVVAGRAVGVPVCRCAPCRCTGSETVGRQGLSREGQARNAATRLPPSPRGGRHGRLRGCRERACVITVVDPDAARRAVRAGLLRCPEAGRQGRLRVWSAARARRVRRLGAEVVALRPDWARCRGCGAARRVPASVLDVGGAGAVAVRGSGVRAVPGGSVGGTVGAAPVGVGASLGFPSARPWVVSGCRFALGSGCVLTARVAGEDRVIVRWARWRWCWIGGSVLWLVVCDAKVSTS